MTTLLGNLTNSERTVNRATLGGGERLCLSWVRLLLRIITILEMRPVNFSGAANFNLISLLFARSKAFELNTKPTAGVFSPASEIPN